MILKRQSGFLRPLLLTVIGLVSLLLVAALIVSLFRIPISLERYKPLLETELGNALGREVRVTGDIRVTTSLWPYFEIEGLHIANPADFGEGDLAVMEQARVTLGLLALLERRIRIRDFRVSGLNLNLQRSAAGETNWVLAAPGAAEPSPAEEAPAVEDGGDGSTASLAVDELLLEDIRVSYRNAGQEPLVFAMEQAQGTAAAGDPMGLSMRGTLLEEDFELAINSSSLADFLAMNRSKLGMQLAIAGTRLTFTGRGEALRGGLASRLHLAITGEDLSSLNELLRLDLPPLADYRIKADVNTTPGRLELASLQASVKDSLLTGSMIVDRTGARPFATLDLNAEHIQLRDFDTGDWSAEGAATDPTEQAPSNESAAAGQEQAAAQAKILSPDALQRADARLTITVAEVMSAEDRLGSGKLELTLQDGRISLAPLQLQLPESSLQMEASLKPGKVASQASLKLLIDNFDVGVLSRLSDPDSDIGGRLNVDLDVTAAASNTNILSGANGYFDVSGQLENFHSNLVDLWAANLLAAVVSSAGKEENISEINCLLSRFRLTDGVMVAEQLVTDTSKIRICGEGEIRFTDRTFNLVVSPAAKRAEFFSLATPLAVKGEFDDFSIGTRAGVLSVGTTAVKFAVSPITTPVKRLFNKELPEDGADVCSLPIGPREGELEPVPGC